MQTLNASRGSIIAHDVLTILFFLGVLTLAAVHLGKFVARVFSVQGGKEIN